jgi:hypothetical protein
MTRISVDLVWWATEAHPSERALLLRNDRRTRFFQAKGRAATGLQYTLQTPAVYYGPPQR